MMHRADAAHASHRPYPVHAIVLNWPMVPTPSAGGVNGLTAPESGARGSRFCPK